MVILSLDRGMSKEIKARVNAHVATFKEGDLINTLIDSGRDAEGVEVDGRIVSIDGHKARIETPWGIFSCNLSLSTKM